MLHPSSTFGPRNPLHSQTGRCVCVYLRETRSFRARKETPRLRCTGPENARSDRTGDDAKRLGGTMRTRIEHDFRTGNMGHDASAAKQVGEFRFLVSRRPYLQIASSRVKREIKLYVIGICCCFLVNMLSFMWIVFDSLPELNLVVFGWVPSLIMLYSFRKQQRIF